MSKGRKICYLQEVDVKLHEIRNDCLGATSIYHKRGTKITGAHIFLQSRPSPIDCVDIITTVLHEMAHAFSRCTKDSILESSTEHSPSWVECMGCLIRIMHSMPYGPALMGMRDLITTLGYTWADVLFVWPYAHPQ